MMAQMALRDLGEKTPARPARPGAQGARRRRPGLRLRVAPLRRTAGRAASSRPRPRSSSGSSASLRPGKSPEAIARDSTAKASPGRGAALVEHHDPRPGRPRHGPLNKPLPGRAGVEPLLLCEGPAHRPARGAAEPAAALGGPPFRSCASSATSCGQAKERQAVPPASTTEPGRERPP